MQRTFVTGVMAILFLGPVAAAQQAPPQSRTQGQSPPQNGPSSQPVTITARQISPDVLSGTWDYNDQLSVDAATGRPERAPRSALQRPAGSTAAGGARSGPSAGGDSGRPTPPAGGVSGGMPTSPADSSGNFGGGGAGRDSFAETRRAMAAVIAAERRTYIRDLLEVPEYLTIKATTDHVTIADDLGRERSYSTNGQVQKYMLSAAQYHASGSWTDTYFKKNIDGANNFRMSETYFLSEDGNRLFVIIRIGDPKKPETLAGINRVYDRVSGSR